MNNRRTLAAIAASGLALVGCGERPQDVRHGHPIIADLDDSNSAKVRGMLDEALRTERPGSDGDSDAEIVLGALLLGGKLNRIEALLIEQNRLLRAIAERDSVEAQGDRPAATALPQKTR